MEKTNKSEQLRKMDLAAYIVSAAVIFLVVLMRRVKLDVGMDFSFLPPLHASLNGLAAVCLLMALFAAKKGQINKHRTWITGALVSSVLFLLSYVVYHFTTVETRFCKEGSIRYIYFFLLITHVVLAGVILPFILMTFNRGYLGFVEKHRKFAKWVWPLWFYVAITGPVLYLMLKPCYV